MVGGTLLRRGQRLLIAAEAVVEHRGCPVDDAQAPSLAAGHQIVYVGLDQLGEVEFAASPGGQPQRPVGCERAPGRLGDRLRFREQGGGGGELTGELVHAHAVVQGGEKRGEGAGIAAELEVTGGERLPALVVPHESGDVAGDPEPAETLLPRDVMAAEGAYRALQQRAGCRVSL